MEGLDDAVNVSNNHNLTLLDVIQTYFLPESRISVAGPYTSVSTLSTFQLNLRYPFCGVLTYVLTYVLSLETLFQTLAVTKPTRLIPQKAFRLS